MGFRKTGQFYAPREKEEQFCDICGKTISDPSVWYYVREDFDNSEFDRTWDVCSPACLSTLSNRLASTRT